MTFRKLPVLASWLLERTGNGHLHESLVGDLIQEYQRGRTSVWLWRQVFAVVFRHFLRTLRIDGPSFVGALVSGGLFLLVTHDVFSYLGSQWINYAAALDLPWHSAWRFVMFWILWGASMVLGYAAAGWLVCRIHTRHQFAVVIAFSFAVLLGYFPEFHRLLINAAAHERFVPYLRFALLNMIFAPALALLGGLWHLRPPLSDDRHNGPA